MLCKQPLYQAHTLRGILWIPIGSDLICKTLCDAGSSNDHLALAAFLLTKLHNILHTHHRGSHQRGQPDNRSIFTNRGIHDIFTRHIFSHAVGNTVLDNGSTKYVAALWSDFVQAYQAAQSAFADLKDHDYKKDGSALQTLADHLQKAYDALCGYGAYEALDSAVSRVKTVSALSNIYAEKNTLTRIRQKSSDLRRIVQTALEREIKKYDLQLAQMKDTEKREKYRIYGELLNTYGYSAKPGDKSLTAVNYYTSEPVTIPLDPTLSATENAKKYFDKYGKLKRTYEACP